MPTDQSFEQGRAFLSAGNFVRAEASLREAVLQQPKHADAFRRLGQALEKQNKFTEAETVLRQALELEPTAVETHNLLGVTLAHAGKVEEAIRAYRQALTLAPDHPDAHNNLGNALRMQGNLDEAVVHLERALQLKSDSADALNNLGNAIRDQGKNEEAARRFERALEIRPGFAEAHNNLGIVRMHQGRIWDALGEYEEALQLRPDYPEAHLNRALAWLALGNFSDGWTEYEWRWKLKDINERAVEKPRWDGSDLKGRTLLIYAEQGLGDTLQFARYFSLLKKKHGRVLFECPRPLASLLSRCPDIDQLIPHGGPLPPFDCQAPLLGLPGALGTTLATVPGDVPYLFANPSLVVHWKKKLADLTGIKVGIGWQGSTKYKGDRHRSVPLEQFAPLARLPGVQLISLQKGAPGTQQLQENRGGFSVFELGPDFDEKNGAFEDTAAVMRCLDLVVSSDSAIVHLAGALGVPVWVPLPLAVDWRWLRVREDSPWYPTMRLFRQQTFGAWSDVFERIAQELQGRLASDADGVPTDRYAEEQRRQEKRRLDLIKGSKPRAAIHLYRHSLKIRADRPEDHNNLGVALARENRLEEALACFQTAVRIQPRFADAFNNRGLALLSLGLTADAIGCFREALRLKPKQPEVANNLGVTLQRQGQLKEALAAYDQAIQLRPEYAEAHVNRARAWLIDGDLARGFPELEWRLEINKEKNRPPAKLWKGEPLAGQTITLHMDNRPEETLLLVRYARRLQEMGGRVALKTPPALAWLHAGFRGVEPLLLPADRSAKEGVHAQLLSLPALCQTTRGNIPGGPPYLTADPMRAEDWRRKLSAFPGCKVGLIWNGPSHASSQAPGNAKKDDWARPLDLLAAQPDLSGLSFFHVYPAASKAAEVPAGPSLTRIGSATRITFGADPWPDLVALMSVLDLVIAVDSPAAHLAGALGNNCWNFLPRAADWCWMKGRHDSPWYPSLRLFRQQEQDDWSSVVAEVYSELRKLAACARPGGAIAIPVAPGELIDKITILEIKSKRVSNPDKLQFIHRELALLQAARDRFIPSGAGVREATGELAAVNEELWNIEDELRLCESKQYFGPRFVALARSVYQCNDRRAALKRRINDLLGSDIREEKAYGPEEASPE